MGDTNMVEGSPPSQGDGQGQRHKRGPWHHRFTEDEIRVFKECKRESLLYRALPLAAIFGAITYAAVAKGYLTPNKRFGAIPKMTLAAILGYGIGKISYRKTCMKKMMALPNSNIGQFLKNRRENCGPCCFRGGFPMREGMMMVGAGADPRDLHWGTGPLPSDQNSAPEKRDV
ncbi:unnamed protein product [Arctia plantaginis]|uniref:OCIA domain-containing protein n=1 Tax=Arctia plantaginis TaxID=874455 RepID=A0A8S0Z8D0_ARCPL|nr:unnamed protein product [Arctia plantaginis]